MRSTKTADYGSGPSLAMAPISGDIAAEVVRDEDSLTRPEGALRQGIPIAVLPDPLAPPTLTPTASPTPTPTPTPILDSPAAPSPAATAPTVPSQPTATLETPSSPTPLSPTATSQLPSPTPNMPTASPPATAFPTSPPPTNTPSREPTSDLPSDPTDEPTSEPTSTPVPLRVAFSAGAYSVDEGAAVAIITVTLDRASDQTVSVDYSTSNLTASAGEDYTAVAGTITFTSGQTSQMFTVPIIDDVQNEIDEAIVLSLGNPVNGDLGSPASVLLTIVDDDPPTVQFVSGDHQVGEGAGSVTIGVRLSTPSTVTVTVPYSSTDLTARAGDDYSAVAGMLTFAPGETALSFAISIVDDVLDEPDEETAILVLGNPTDGTLGTPSSAFLRITDNDPTPEVRFDPADYLVNEGDGTATLTVTLSAPSALAATVDYDSSGGTATAGSDYTAVSGTVSFAPLETSQTFTVPVLEDILDEADETVLFALSNPAEATLGSPFTATLTIEDNEEPAVQFSAPDYMVIEDAGQAIITVTLSLTSDLPVSVNYSSADNTAIAGQDYGAVNGTLNFAPLETSRVFTVSITDDAIDEAAEDLQLALSDPVNAVLGTPYTATLTIGDNDGQPAVQFSDPAYSVVEGAGTATITVTLDGPSASPVTVNYGSTDITATDPADYVGVSGVLSFDPMQVTNSFTVTINDDGIRELDEELQLTLDSPVGATLGAQANATLTIVDDEAEPAVQFSAGSYTVAENGGQATLTVTVTPLSALTVTVPFSSTTGGTATPGADYTPVNGALIIAPLEANQTFTVPIINDLLDEIDQETVQLGLGTPTNALLGTPYTATVIIEDDDLPPTVQFNADTYDVAEDGGQATITVELSAPSEREISVDYLSNDGTATAGEDYEAVAATLTFLPPQTSVTFTVTILDDSFVEANETVNLTLQNPSNAELGPTVQATLAITDNDHQPSPPCTGLYPPGEPNLGPPNGTYARVACDEGIIITLPTPATVTGEVTDTEYELIYYELLGIPLPVTGTIYMDLVRISIGNNPGSTDENDWYDVFYWGDGITDTNTSLVDYTGPPDVPPGCPSTYLDTGPAVDNMVICAPPLVGPTGRQTGIPIDVDNSPIESVPPGDYQYVRIFSPATGELDGPEVDSIEVISP